MRPRSRKPAWLCANRLLPLSLVVGRTSALAACHAGGRGFEFRRSRSRNTAPRQAFRLWRVARLGAARAERVPNVAHSPSAASVSLGNGIERVEPRDVADRLRGRRLDRRLAALGYQPAG
jgi:hypothetical protein